MRSLQARLMLGAGLIIALALLVSNVIVHAATRSSLFSEFDKSLLTRAQSLTVLVEHTEEGIDVEFRESDFQEFTREEAPDYFQIWHPDGTTLAKSGSLRQRNLALVGVQEARAEFADFRWQDEPSRRQIAMQWYPVLDIDEDEDEDEDELDDDGDLAHDGELDDKPRSNILLTIALARSTENVHAQLSRLGWLLMIVGTSVTIGCLAVLLFVIRQGLQPVTTVANTLSTIDETKLDQQIAPNDTPIELAPIISRLNELLARLELAFQRERDFSNNVAHELRTPLAGLTSTIEVHLSRQHEPAEYRSALESCLDICYQSSEMVESLLILSRAERDDGNIVRQTVQLDRILRECWAPLVDRSHAKGLTATWDVEPSEFETDKEQLRVILRNVFTNAVSHSDDNGTLDVSAMAENGSVHIQVTNSGNRLTNDQMGRVFDRFWRGDASREGTGEHFGLGLTLVKSLTELLGGQVQIDGKTDRFQLSLMFPRYSCPTASQPTHAYSN